MSLAMTSVQLVGAAAVHSVYDQPDAASVQAQFDRVLDALGDKLPKWPSTSTAPARTCWRSLHSPRSSGARFGAITPASASTAKSGAGPTSWASSPTAT